MTADEFIERLRATGWLDQLPSEQMQALVARVRERSQGPPDKMHLGLAAAWFDPRCIEDDDSYPTILQAYVEASHGTFTPTEIAAELDWEEGAARVAIRIQGRRVSRTVPLEGKTFEMAVHGLVNRAMSRIGTTERFFGWTDEGLVGLVCVRPDAFRSAVRAKLVPRCELVEYRERPWPAAKQAALQKALQDRQSDDPDTVARGSAAMVQLFGGFVTEEALEQVREEVRQRNRAKAEKSQ